MLVLVTARTSTVLIGREAESANLRDALKRARAGEPGTVLIGGEAGVGKTRLVEEFRRSAEADGAQVLTGQCVELGEEGLPFAPFVAALRDLLRHGGRDAIEGWEQEFGMLLPELAPVAGARTPGVGTSRGHLFDLVAGVFERLAAEHPLVLVIEDLHWADRSTRDLLAFLIRTARADHALLVVTYRSDELHRGHPLRPFLAELDRVRGVERLEVDRLCRDGTAEILANLLAAQPPAALIDNIHDRAQGNPFFIEELAACTDPATGCHLPDTLRDLLLTRVDQLADSAQRVLRIAAAGGNRVGHALLAEVAGLPEAELENAMRAAVLAQLVVADADGGYRFRHALVREAVHDDLLPGEHARLHARYAASIEAAPDLVATGRAAVETAHHWYAAGDRSRALTAALRAAHEAGRRYAYAEQSRLLDRVLELWEQVPDAPERTGLSHLALLERALEAAVEAGDHMRGMKLTRAALSEVNRDAEPLRAARLLERRGKLLRTFGKSDGQAELRQAYELAGRITDSWDRAALLADLAAAMALVDRAAGARVAREAGARAEQLGDVSLQVSTALTLGRVFGGTVSAEAGLAEMRRAAELVAAAGDQASSLRVLVSASDLLFGMGRYAEAAETAERGLLDIDRVGIVSGAYLLGNLAEALVALGRWDEADAHCTEAVRLDPPGAYALLWLIPQATVWLARGRAGAGEVVERALGYLSWPYLVASNRLPLHALRIEAALAGLPGAGDPAEAATRALTDPALRSEPRYAWPVLAAVAALDEPDLRTRVRELAGSLPAVHPAERAYAAQVAARQARAEEALPAWAAAVDAWRTDGQPYPLARALAALAEAAAQAGERTVVAEALAEANAIAARLDAARLCDELAVLARRLGLRTGVGTAPVGCPAPNGGNPPLTDREREVLRLVADGLSNRRIADELFISPKTASVHVSRIIAKLEVANRIEAAAVARRLGLLADERQ